MININRKSGRMDLDFFQLWEKNFDPNWFLGWDKMPTGLRLKGLVKFEVRSQGRILHLLIENEPD